MSFQGGVRWELGDKEGGPESVGSALEGFRGMQSDPSRTSLWFLTHNGRKSEVRATRLGVGMRTM